MRALPAALIALLVSGVHGLKDEKSGKGQGPPPFFLQDPTDSMCLAGEEFKRCSIDTLFYVVGSPGSYQIHKRPVDGSPEDAEGVCLSKKTCNEKDESKISEARLTKCTHCGAKKWNILGDAETGYVLTEGDGDSKVCLVREKDTNKAIVANCKNDDVPYTPLQLQFASAADITAMGLPSARLIGAASDGDKKNVISILKEEDVDVNVRDWDDLTALIPAASSGHFDIVKLLLKEGADVNAKDKDGITALMEASIMGHSKIVDILLESSADVDDKANSEVTALWLAAGENKVDVMKSLLNNDADASNTRVDGITALMTASVAGHVEAVRLLLENGADALVVDNDGLTALMNAAENGSTDVLKVLVEAAKEAGNVDYVDIMSTTGFTALIIAAAHGHTDAVQYLIADAGANANEVHDNGVTALMYAAASGHVDLMKILVDIGDVDVNAAHTNNGSALLEAATAGASDAIKFLIDNGAHFDVVDHDGVTPLMAIASQGNLTGTMHILEALQNVWNAQQLKEHINMLSFSGGSSVMFAAAGGHPEVSQLLIENGADVNAIARATPDYLEKLEQMIEDGTVQDPEPHVDGVTALHVAAQGGHLECINLLIEAEANVGVADDESRTPLLLAVKGNHGEVASALVSGGADPNTPYVDEDGENHNLLMDGMIVENKEFSLLLIENGADLYHKDSHDVTTLLQACHRGMDEIVQALLEKHAAAGSDGQEGWIDVASDEGITPLIASSSEGHLDIVKLLIDAGANVNAKDKDDTNSLMAAAARGHNEAVELILKAGANVNELNVDGHTALMFAYNGKNQVETLWERYVQFNSESKLENTPGDSDEDIDDGGTGPIIQTALDNHIKLVDMLIKNGASEQIKDLEGHVAKDFDFHPDADADILEQEKFAEKQRDESKNEL